MSGMMIIKLTMRVIGSSLRTLDGCRTGARPRFGLCIVDDCPADCVWTSIANGGVSDWASSAPAWGIVDHCRLLYLPVDV
jgi:hypothetical protein